MKPTQELIWALRRAAKRIVDPKEAYCWMDDRRCNCGLLVRELLGISATEVGDLRIGSWSRAASRCCGVTGLPLHDLFDRLAQIGIERDDIPDIEHCRDGICYDYQNPKQVSAYFLRLADSLELQLKGKLESRDPISTEEPTRARIALEGVEA